MPSMNVSLTPELMFVVQQKVKAGFYNNASEVVREALRQMDTNAELLRELKLVHLRETLQIGMGQAVRKEFVEDYSVESLIDKLDKEEKEF